ncbi:MAG: imidazolonepropionase [Bacteroidota bacterium]
MNTPTLIGPFSQLLPMTDLPARGAILDEQLIVLKDAGILVKGEKILSIGKFIDLKNNAHYNSIHELQGKHMGLPGFIDAHTHICYGGSRAHDYALRNAGKTYLEIAKAGGGIWDTVTQTRNASQAELTRNTIERANRHLKNGTTTLEVKSGYGLSVQEEVKMLRAIKEADTETLPDLVPTCLAAHISPKDFDGDAAEYLQEMSTLLFPILKAEKLAHRIDAFIEESAFSPKQIGFYFEKAKSLGFDITVHADQFSTGGSEIAVQFEALSADHLEASTQKEIDVLAKSTVTAMALPGASLGLGCSFAPARKLLDSGVALAIASDHNPGSAPMGNLLTQAAILGAFQKLTNAEVLAGITVRAAKALQLQDRGQLKPGLLADFTVFNTDNYQEILYNQGSIKPSMVWKNGALVYDKHKP